MAYRFLIFLILISSCSGGCEETRTPLTENDTTASMDTPTESPPIIPCVATVYFKGVQPGDLVFVHEELPLIKIHSDEESAWEQLSDDFFWARRRSWINHLCETGEKKDDKPSAELWFANRDDRDDIARQFEDGRDSIKTLSRTEIIEKNWGGEQETYYLLFLDINDSSEFLCQ